MMRAFLLLLILGAGAAPAAAQIDPERRRLLQAGFSLPVEGRGPLSGYLYYYHNHPYADKIRTLRLAVAPVYLDAEYGLKGGLGGPTDLGIGLAGGGFADSYSEIRGGRFLRGESFTGDGVRASLSAYRDFGKIGRAPLAGILRGEGRYAEFRRDAGTEPGFELPNAQTDFNVRAGLRWGGQEPLLMPRLAGELSVWYEGRLRTASGAYGYASDRRVEPHSHMFWSRALIVYNLPKADHRFLAQIAGGTSRRPDRFSAYRLGGVLPQASEFPLSIPGYYYQEVSARDYGLAGGSYVLPLSRDKRTWLATLTLATAVVNYAPGLEQDDKWHSGAGLGVHYTTHAWHALLEYGYGVNANRGHGNGAHSLGVRVQFDFRKSKSPLVLPRDVERSLERALERLPLPKSLAP
ncbi:MAG: hypothetical protein Q8T11_01660 [Elusimicrobiota bacterium]|nr:hypothetical protein [Elusimicrobiota bacterium]